MIRTYLWRGLKAGALAGLALGLVVALVGNPLLGFAESVGHDEAETAGSHDHEGGHDEAGADSHEGANGHNEEGHAVSATVTNAVSVGGGVLWGLLLGVVVFGIGFFFLEPTIPGTGASKSFLLAGAGFVTVAGSPWLVLPPQPGLEQSLPQDARFLWFGVMAVAGAAVCLSSFVLYSRLATGNPTAVAATVALFPFSVLAVLAVVAPVNTLSGSVPELVVRAFQGVTVLGQAVLWGTMAATHAWFHRREAGQALDSQVQEFPERAD